jgi:DNA helicase-2/ATP-dependent DNA helicase PcrA|tara:strand:- start:264 stop:1703 length:1440 start_codon:yes stop_codon:yes gene_type:complete
MRYKVIGPPGTGKTYTLLNEVANYVNKGITLDKIGYFSFTRKAANEARDRFLEINPTLTKKDIKYFQTLHSLAFTRLGLKEENVMQEGNYKKIGETCGVQIKYAAYEKNEWNGIFTSDSEYLSLISLARVKQIGVMDQYNLNEHIGKIQKNKLEAIEKEINNYKNVYGLIDYTDMLDKWLEPKGTAPQFEVIFVDEAQDLSLIQWSMIKKLEENYCKDVWIAGDDDQAIFGWAGADVNSFINWKAKQIPLTESKRVPKLIQQKALDIIERVNTRLDKQYLPRPKIGHIIQLFKLSDVDMSKGQWLILTRTKSLLKPVSSFLKRKGYFFESSQGNSIGKTLYEDVNNFKKIQEGEKLPEILEQRVRERLDDKKPEFNKPWYEAFVKVPFHQINYLKSMLINEENLLKNPRIKISTIHGAKGGESTNVVLYLNQTQNTLKGTKKSNDKYDEEQRVWYVGVTRTMENLYLVKCKNKKKEYKI